MKPEAVCFDWGEASLTEKFRGLNQLQQFHIIQIHLI